MDLVLLVDFLPPVTLKDSEVGVPTHPLPGLSHLQQSNRVQDSNTEEYPGTGAGQELAQKCGVWLVPG